MGVRQKAIGVAWGITSSGYAYTGAATALSVTSESQDLKKTAEMAEHKDEDGETQGLTFFDQKKDLTLRVYPSGATLAAAKAANVIPEPGDKFTITDADDPEMAGDYVTIEAGKGKKAGEKVMFDITLRKWAADLSADTGSGA